MCVCACMCVCMCIIHVCKYVHVGICVLFYNSMGILYICICVFVCVCDGYTFNKKADVYTHTHQTEYSSLRCQSFHQ